MAGAYRWFDLVEDIAGAFHEKLELCHVRAIEPAGLFSAMGFRVSPFVPKGCGGLLEVRGRATVRLDARGHPMAVRDRGGHELTHLAAIVARMQHPHDEQLIDDTTPSVLMPRGPMLDALARCRWDPSAVVATYPEFYPSHVLRRAVAAVGGAAVFYVGRARHVVHDCPHPLPLAVELREAALAEDLLALRARTRDAPPSVRDPSGITAAWFEDPGRCPRRGIAVLIPPDLLSRRSGL